MNFDSELFVFIRKYAPSFLFVSYACGFFLWNYYLSKFGFFEYNLIQARYLSAGLLLSVPILIIIKFTGSWFNKSKIVSIVRLVLIALWLVFLVRFLFPIIPQYFGGAKPIPTAIIGTPVQIDFLTNFAIPAAPNGEGKASVQTMPICLVYQNDTYALFFSAGDILTSPNEKGILSFQFESRILAISREQFIGFQAMSGMYAETQCGLTGAVFNGIFRIPIEVKNL